MAIDQHPQGPGALAAMAGKPQPTASWSGWLVQSLQRPIAEGDRARAARHLVDWLACAYLGRASETGEVMARWAARQAPGSAWACGHNGLHPAESARFNGSLGSLHELDDVHREAVVHPGDTVIPAALAIAQREACSARDLLDAIVVGYEAGIRLGLLAGTAHYHHWYSTATTGAFASAIACARLLRLPSEAMQQALALAGMQASGVWQCRLEPGVAKQVATGHAAQAGLVAADLAAAGATGPLAILEGEHGWLRATGVTPDPQAAQRHLQAAPDASWLLHTVSFKPWPACRHVHPAIGCALQAHAKGLRPQAVQRIELATYAVAIAFADQPSPATPHEARFSLQHAVAWALCQGDFWLNASAPPAWQEAACADLRQRVEVSCGPRQEARYPGRFSARLAVHLEDGTVQVFEEESALGDPEQPMTPGQLHAKAHRMLVNAGVPHADAQGLIEQGLNLPAQEDLQDWWRRLQALSVSRA